MDSRLHILPTPLSGNGVFATSPIPQNTLLLTTSPPYLSVINHVYRKEACGYCFAYNLGRRWKTRCLPPNADTGFVFCGEECREDWEKDVGELGVQAYIAVEALARSGGREKATESQEEDEEAEPNPPNAGDVQQAWTDVALPAAQILAARLDGTGKSKKSLLKATSAHSSPDVLSFLLSGVLALQKAREGNLDPLLIASLQLLYAAPVPYISHASLFAHTTAYLHLLSVLPSALLDLVTPANLQRITGIAYDNAFGIRSVDNVSTVVETEDPGSELLGYAVYPTASLFNHSCLPNVRKAREGRLWRFWSSREIEAGREVCITYLGGDERSLNVAERRERLKGGWEFECACEGCRQ